MTDPYLYPGTDVLRSKENIRDARELQAFERMATASRMETLLDDTPITADESAWTPYDVVNIARMGAADTIDHPPPKDYWKNITTWFKSKWWSVPAFLFFVTLPLIAGWIEILTTFLKWIGAIKDV